MVSPTSVVQTFGETAGSLGENRKRKLYVHLDSVIGLFLVHRRPLPKAAMQAQNPNLQTAHPVLLPPHQDLSRKRNGRVNLGRGPARKHRHTVQAPSWCPPTSELRPPALQRGPSSSTSREPGHLSGLWPLGSWTLGQHVCPEARSMLPSCGHFRKCACSTLNWKALLSKTEHCSGTSWDVEWNEAQPVP